MISAGDFTFAPVAGSAALVVHRLPIDESWPAAPMEQFTESEVLFRPLRDDRSRMQRLIDGIDSQVAVIDLDGKVVAANRAWRLTAKMQGMANGKSDLGLNYLAVCGTAAAQGDRDAAVTAEGIEGVMQGRSKSFYYKYQIRAAGELRMYALLAFRIADAGQEYVAISHELLETRLVG